MFVGLAMPPVNDLRASHAFHQIQESHVLEFSLAKVPILIMDASYSGLSPGPRKTGRLPQARSGVVDFLDAYSAESGRVSGVHNVP